MQGVTSRETHFRYSSTCKLLNYVTYIPDTHSVFITSPAFQGKMQLARHRMINSLMKDELAQEGGIHALQLITRTPEEDEARKQKEATQG